MNALSGKPLPIYGDGKQVRDWLYVDDHVRALYCVVTKGEVGETYNIGGCNEKTNLEVVTAICELLEELAPTSSYSCNETAEGFLGLITYVTDRPGHDTRYAIDASKIARELNWQPIETFESGLRKTVIWYLDNQDWCKHVQSKIQGNKTDVKHSQQDKKCKDIGDR